jgi:DnaJ-class molecular chaperone
MRWSLCLLLVASLRAQTMSAQSATPAHPHGSNVGPCATCHSPDGWKPARISKQFRHAPRTFPLDGAHAGTPCASCHASLDFSKAQPACAQCHRDVHSAEMGSDCAQCHTARSFADQTNLRRQHEITRFPLRGAHATLACASCHPAAAPGQSQYRRRPTACIGCHASTYRAVRAPDHQAAGFPQNCALCHSSATWSGGRFDHATTAFALTGGHAAVACNACHGDGVFRGKPTTCVTCHQADYTWTRTPPHAASGLPTDCLMCHTVKAWTGAGFNHEVTQFPLTGAHRAALCGSCHADNVYKGKPTACISCHQRDFTAALNPPHTASFPTACASCHGTTAWSGGIFDHAATAFALTGAHRTAACARCHGDGIYRGKSTACAACHQAAYAATTNPPHAASGFPTTCSQCHGTAGWLGSAFDHATTAFPLTGAHRASACAACHHNNVFRGTPTECVSCHQSAYNATTRPPHQTLALPTVCFQCHTTNSWAGGTFDHGVTRFALTGAHRAVSCAGCHADGIYRGKPMLCASCHQSRFDATTNPSHRAAAFPSTCEVCHGTTAWTPSSFSHSATRFALTGAHLTAPCASCHGDGVYRGKTTLCNGCHLAAYNSTTNPNHKAAMFPTACESCHTTSRWSGATFNHDGSYFPIYSGKHKGRWSTCADCHTVSTNYAIFSCFSCHRQTEMDSKHRDRTGYRYDSALCYQCHPQGKS